MKALTQIISYLNERGVLTAEHLAYLERHGLWDRYADHREEGPVLEPYFGSREPLPVDDWDEEVDSGVRRVPGKRGARQDRELQERARTVEAPELGSRLADCFAGWRDSLHGLVQVGQRLGPCAGWQEAAVLIRNARPEAVRAAVRDGLRGRAPTLAAFWDALELEDYRDVFEKGERQGPAASAYRAVLETPEYAQLGKYAWLLKTEPVGHVFNLKQAQRRLLRACEQVFTQELDLIRLSLHRDYHVLAYWSFVLLYTARKGQARATPAEHQPARRPPDEAGWLRVWADTTAMDPAGLLPFLVQHRDRPIAELLTEVLVCPRCWDWPGDPDAWRRSTDVQ